MKVINIGPDRNVFDASSAVRERTREYAKHLSELNLVVFSLTSHGLREQHEGNLHIYPTNSSSRFLYPFDAARIAKKLAADVVTVQDPFEAGLAGVLAKQKRPLHVQLHTDPFARQFGGFLNTLRLLIMPFVLARASRVRVVSKHVKEKLVKKYPRLSVSVLPIYVDLQKFSSIVHSSHPRFKTTLLWVGRFETEKIPRWLSACSRQHLRTSAS
jgi:glycosyltransferase involved in cell wall biosynthesis